jgi:hypothetical protein
MGLAGLSNLRPGNYLDLTAENAEKNHKNPGVLCATAVGNYPVKYVPGDLRASVRAGLYEGVAFCPWIVYNQRRLIEVRCDSNDRR